MLSLFSLILSCFVLVSAQPGGLGGPGGPGGIGGIGGPGGIGGIGGIGGPGGIGGIGGPGGISGLGNVAAAGLSQQQQYQYPAGYYNYPQQGYPAQTTSTSSPSFLDRVFSMSSNAIRGLTGQPQQVQSQLPYYNYQPQTGYNPAYNTAGAGAGATTPSQSQSIPAVSTSSINTNTNIQPIVTTQQTAQTGTTRTPLTLANSALQQLFGEGVTMPPISEMNPPPNAFPFANPSASTSNSNANIPSAVVLPSTNAASAPSTTTTSTSAVNTDLLQRLRQRVVSPVNTGVAP